MPRGSLPGRPRQPRPDRRGRRRLLGRFVDGAEVHQHVQWAAVRATSIVLPALRARRAGPRAQPVLDPVRRRRSVHVLRPVHVLRCQRAGSDPRPDAVRLSVAGVPGPARQPVRHLRQRLHELLDPARAAAGHHVDPHAVPRPVAGHAARLHHAELHRAEDQYAGLVHRQPVAVPAQPAVRRRRRLRLLHRDHRSQHADSLRADHPVRRRVRLRPERKRRPRHRVRRRDQSLRAKLRPGVHRGPRQLLRQRRRRQLRLRPATGQRERRPGPGR